MNKGEVERPNGAQGGPLQKRITIYKSCLDTTGNETTLHDFLSSVRDGQQLASLIAELRRIYWRGETAEGNAGKAAREAYAAAKRRLPAAALSGVFQRRAINGLRDYNGIIQADFDHLKRKGFDIAALKEKLSADPHIVFIFESPSGDGLKCGVLVDSGPDEHGEAFLVMQRYFQAVHGLAADDATKDVSRLCFASHDPSLVINEAARPLDWREWSEPAPEESDGDSDVTELPLDAFPDIIQRFAKACAEVYQVDVSLAAVAGLTVLAAALGKSVKCARATSGRITPCNLFTVIVAPSGYGKGVVGIAAGPLIAASAEMAQRFEEYERPGFRAGIAMAEARRKDLLSKPKGNAVPPGKDEIRAELATLEREIEQNLFNVAHSPSYYVGSATGAALGVALKRNKEALLSYALEAGDAIRVAGGKFNADSKADYDLLLSGYTGEPFTEARISRQSVRLSEPCLSVLWTVQPTLIRELYGTAEAQERGLLARINVVQCDDDVAPLDDGVFREIPASLENEWNGLVREALYFRAKDQQVIFQASAEATEVFRRFHNEAIALRNGECRESEAKLRRCRENAIRIASVIAAAERLLTGSLENNSILTAEHATRGVAIARYFLAQTLTLTHNAVIEKRQERLEELLACVERDGGGITLRKLKGNHGFGETETRQIVERNPNFLRIEERGPTAKGGRRSVWVVAAKEMKTGRTPANKTNETNKTSPPVGVSQVSQVSQARYPRKTRFDRAAHILERASKYVSAMPAGVSGSGGHNATFAAAVALCHGFALPEGEAWPILCDFNARCDPPWSENELRHKLRSAAAVSRHPRPRGYLISEDGDGAQKQS